MEDRKTGSLDGAENKNLLFVAMLDSSCIHVFSLSLFLALKPTPAKLTSARLENVGL